jgi:hypothetical protein
LGIDQSLYRSVHAQIFLRVSISILSSLIKFEIARLDVRSAASTPGTKSSTLPEDGSTILIKSAPFVFTVQVQERGNKPLSMMCLSSKAEIIDVRPDEKFHLSLVYETQESRNAPKRNSRRNVSAAVDLNDVDDPSRYKVK